MQLIKARFDDFDLFNEEVSNWELDFRLLSKNGFNAFLNMFMAESFSLSRTKLKGKIEQKGLAPKGFRSIVVPIDYNSEYIWLNKKVNGKELLIFPRNSVLDGISFSDFDVYVVSIEETMLFQILESLGYKNSKKLFSGDEHSTFLSKAFSQNFHQLAGSFLNTPITDQKRHHRLINSIIHFLLKYIEDSNEIIISIPQKKKDVALRKVVEIINSHEGVSLSVKQLCELASVSERTLQYAFKDKYKVSPSEYIKAYRLNRVKRELFSSKDENINIFSIAAKYDFWHMSQFSSDFKKQFGILPSNCLNK